MALTKIDDRGLKTPIDLQDNENIRLGTGNDLQIYHDGSHNYILSSNGHVHLVGDGTNQVKITAKNNEQGILITPNGSVELYYDNSKKFETTSSGIKGYGTGVGHIFLGDFRVKTEADANFVTFKPAESLVRWHDNHKAVFGASNDLQLYHDGTHSYIYNTTGELKNRAAIWKVVNAANSEIQIKATENAAVELYYDNVKKFETRDAGATLFGDLYMGDDKKIRLGDGGGGDLRLYHDGSNSYIQHSVSGNLRYQSNNHDFYNQAASQFMCRMFNGDTVRLYHNGSARFETTSYGTRTTGYHTQSSNVGFQGDAADWTSSTPYMHNMTLQWNSGHFVNSTGVFTCPVAGKYLCSATVQAHRANNPSGSSGQYFNVLWQKNNSNYHVESVGTVATDASALSTSAVNGKHGTVTATVIIDCAANDTIRAYSNHGYRHNTQNICSVYLLG